VDEEEVDSGWYLDSGVTHHMTGRQEFFADLNTDIRGTVRFGDASKVEIKGVGSIVFQAKTGEQRVLHGVYFIPALKNSILSLDSLMKEGPRLRLTMVCFAFGTRAAVCLPRYTEGRKGCIFCILRLHNLSVLRRARMMRRGNGMSVSAICTSTHSGD
jgi:hypothetical protein